MGIYDILFYLESPEQYNGDKLIEIINITEKYLADKSLLSDDWKQFLALTGRPRFLTCLPDDQTRIRWAELCFAIIRKTGYSLLDMFRQKLSEHPNRILFQDMSGSLAERWSYRQIEGLTAEIAAALYTISKDRAPVVAIYCENSVISAACDLACLFYNIIVTPLNVHFDAEIIRDISEQMDVNIIITDTEERYNRLTKLKDTLFPHLHIILTNQDISTRSDDSIFLGKYCKSLGPEQIRNVLGSRTRMPINKVCTVMWTSGSTGKPKGVSFSNYNLTTKRFARSAALPQVGQREVLLCYLPLFHTFGRYFEMMGMIYWGGTYVFTGNPSSDTLLSLFPEVNPTGFISVPVRWVQLYEKCMKAMQKHAELESKQKAMREILGKKLRWGLSAAGYLDPKIFQFYEQNGVNICSGFGMTEGTGGITMTPPGNYVEGTNGLPLPGIYTRLSKQGELQMRGHYVARYMPDFAPEDTIPYPVNDEEDYWMGTGDVFQKLDNGYYTIVDRIKDIYKNNKGQTIAPLRVEMKFSEVPGIKHAFLVGDGRAYNTLLIVPDKSEKAFGPHKDGSEFDNYLHQIITQANQDLAPYERVINYLVTDRDFSTDNKELTPKGSFNRKVIEKNFAGEIDRLYESNLVMTEYQGITIKIPRWLYRDQGILEDDILLDDSGLLNRNTGKRLNIIPMENTDIALVGDLEYKLTNKTLDLGLLAHQPRLWLGNPELISFTHCKPGWDLPMPQSGTQLMRPWKIKRNYKPEDLPDMPHIRDKGLVRLNRLVSMALFGDDLLALDAVHKLEWLLTDSEERVANVIRRRLEAMSRHPDENLRCLAYRILLLDEPNLDYSTFLPSFIESGLSFINSDSIEFIVSTKLEKRRLEALRQRLFTYRTKLQWPAAPAMRRQFEYVFRILVNFVERHPGFYNTVRAELASWILHEDDTGLAGIAAEYFSKLAAGYEDKLLKEQNNATPVNWRRKIVYDDNLRPDEIEKINNAIIGTTFLKQSILLAFDQKQFDPADIRNDGLWVSRINSASHNLIYRLSITTKQDRHFDLLMTIFDNIKESSILNVIYRLVAVAGYPYFPRVMPHIGCCRPELNAISVSYISELTVWEKIREFSGLWSGKERPKLRTAWRKLFVEAFAAYFRGWHYSERKVITGAISPENVVVPEKDYQDGATILSLSGMREYTGPLDIIEPMFRNFYKKTVAHYPWCQNQLNIDWIFDSVIEALGQDDASIFFGQLAEALKVQDLWCIDESSLSAKLKKYLQRRADSFYKPLAMHNAIARYGQWARMNPLATHQAREQALSEMYRLYRLGRYPDIVRYYIYRNTYFENASTETLNSFDNLLSAMNNKLKTNAINLIELSDLQASINNDEDLQVFSRMVFPNIRKEQRFDILKIGSNEGKHTIVHTYITDIHGERYTFRRPVKPSEIGQLYRLFHSEKFPMAISTQDKYYVVVDMFDRVIGGICYKKHEHSEVLIDGIAVSSPLKGRQIGSAMIEDFCDRMTGLGINVVKTHFFTGSFYRKMGFTVDKRWGALVRVLNEDRQK